MVGRKADRRRRAGRRRNVVGRSGGDYWASAAVGSILVGVYHVQLEPEGDGAVRMLERLCATAPGVSTRRPQAVDAR